MAVLGYIMSTTGTYSSATSATMVNDGLAFLCQQSKHGDRYKLLHHNQVYITTRAHTSREKSQILKIRGLVWRITIDEEVSTVVQSRIAPVWWRGDYPRAKVDVNGQT